MRRKVALRYEAGMRRAEILVLAVLWFVPAAASAAVETAPAARGPAIIAAMRANRWADAAAAAARSPDPIAEKLVTFYRLLTPGGAGAGEIAAFLADNPDWPLASLLARRRDEALAAEPDDGAALEQCARTPPPAAAPALLRCANTYANSGRMPEATADARRAWLTGLVDAGAETLFMQRWGSVITPEDQWRRFDALAWSDTDAASRQEARLAAADKPRAEARLALRRDEASAPALVAALPAAQRADPALFLEQAAWLRRAGQDDDARTLWRSGGEAAERGAPLEHLAAFWGERNRLARRLLRDGDAAGAYALADDPAQRAPEQVADAGFLAGFIALRRLHDPATAATHFREMATVSKAAITQARAHYWLGRAAEARRDGAAAAVEYAAAAAWPTTFYGQLAAFALGTRPEQLAARIRGIRDPGWTPAQALGFAGDELARAATELVAWGDKRRARVFLLQLGELAADGADRSLAARLALGFGLPDQAVAIARRAGREGVMLPDSGWPMAAPVAEDGAAGAVMPAVTLGLIRQESSFDAGALSPAGARGLMQLMPATAVAVAQRIGAAPSLAALTGDPSYNVRLGTAYLGSLLEQFEGVLPFALAAYNAGPNRVQDWLAENGDPTAPARPDQPDIIDWIELIPFAETRNYVQRVIENVVIYQAKRKQAPAHPLAPYLLRAAP
ncbi:MAG: lytic transglycosylase domain-containing protein [Acidisphaera sp.]|nr:lytic transglycosylase domain-containing protein [Acidisphaera sp.]